MIPMKKHIALLGYRVRDKVTGVEGVVASISFDLYGCIQAIVNPGADKDGKLKDQVWFDVARLELASKKPVMTPPDFDCGIQAEGKQGAAEKPLTWKV
jgi:hypothetical protein